jgi:glycine cleavage system H protein
MAVPTDRGYTAEHEWLAVEGDVARVGITEYAADALGDVVYIELPAVGAELTAGQACGEIESTKSVSEIFAPAAGVVLSVNEEVTTSPEVVNADAFGAGWLFTMQVTGTPDLLDAAAYERLTRESSL